MGRLIESLRNVPGLTVPSGRILDSVNDPQISSGGGQNQICALWVSSPGGIALISVPDGMNLVSTIHGMGRVLSLVNEEQMHPSLDPSLDRVDVLSATAMSGGE